MLEVSRREWQRFLATPRLWLLALIAPLGLSLVLLWIFAQRMPQDLPLVVVDYDHSAASRLLARQMEASSALQLRASAADMREAAGLVRRGQAYGVLVIPPQFERDLLRNESPGVQLYYNRQMLTAGNLLMRNVRTVLATVSAGVGMAHGVAPAILMELHPVFNPGMDYARFLGLPLTLALLHIAMVVVAVDVTGRELREGTAAAWLAAADGSWWRALLGKLLPWGLWFICAGLLWLVASLRWLGVEFAGQLLPWVMGWVLLVLACLGLGAFLVAATGNLRMAASVASLIVSPAFAFGGLTFPADYMPAFAQLWSWLLPLTHGLAVHVQQASMAAPASAALPHLACLALFSALPFLLWRRWHRLLTDPQCWGAQ